MPRIAHVVSTPEGIGGAERVVAELVEEGGRRGWEQIVLNPFALDPDHSELRDLCAPAPYRGRRCAQRHEVPGMLLWLRRELTSYDPDVVHAHLFHANVAVALVRRSGPRYVVTHHHGDHLVKEQRLRDAVLDRLAGRRFDRIVAVSNWVADFLIFRYRYPSGKVICIPNGWSGDPLPECGLASHPTVICVARFRPQKGHADLLTAFAIVKREIADARLLLVGDGELGLELRSQGNALGLGESVEFRGTVGNVWPHLAEAHVFALASRYEPLGIAVLEAMAAGLPIVATNVGGIPELIEPGITGRLVSPGAPEEMADALVELLTAPEVRERMGAAGRSRAAAFKSSDAMRRYFDLYGELLEIPD